MTAAVLDEFRAAGEDLFRCGLVVPGSGNLSVWTPAGVIVTREGAALHRLQADDLCLISRSTEPPVATPSLDTPIHRAIYVSAGAGGIVHAHPAHCIAVTLGRSAFEPPDLEGGHRLGRIPVVSPRRSVIDLIAQAIGDARAVIVEGHGVYVRGRSLEEAVQLTALLEESARIAWLRTCLNRLSHHGGHGAHGDEQ
jgi:L-fuculose-phosphate aldolase